jgi:hypothetical protein
VFGADWNWRDFNLEPDMAKVDAMLGPSVNGATVGDLSKFRDRGGKMIIYQGCADPIVPPLQTVAFYKGVSDKFGGDQSAQGFARLFLAPGFGHCFGGPAPTGSTLLRFSVWARRRPTPAMTRSPRSPIGWGMERRRPKSSRQSLSTTIPPRGSPCSVRFVPIEQGLVQGRRRHKRRRKFRLRGHEALMQARKSSKTESAS